jgi:hypothetical protein
MKIVCSELYEQQLQAILETMAQEDFKKAKDFKLYLDTLIINVPTKALKYKKSLFFDNENIKDVEYNGFLVPFFFDVKENTYCVLGIIKE